MYSQYLHIFIARYCVLRHTGDFVAVQLSVIRPEKISLKHEWIEFTLFQFCVREAIFPRVQAIHLKQNVLAWSQPSPVLQASTAPPGFGRPRRFHAKRGWPKPKAQTAPLRIQYGRGGCSGLRPRWPPLADIYWIFYKMSTTLYQILRKQLMYLFVHTKNKQKHEIKNKKKKDL